MGSPIEIVYANPVTPGYHCMYHMAQLAAELFDGDLIVLDTKPATTIEKFSALLPRPRSGVACLFICPAPGRLDDLLLIKGWRNRYSRLVAWVFDSFWTDHVSRVMRLARVFDHVFVTEPEDVDQWRRMVRVPVDWLPWGSDVLRLGSREPKRHIDLLRFGRQPGAWDDDQSSEARCHSLGLAFQGRPPVLGDATESHCSLMRFLSQAKLTLAFSNRVSPSGATHPHREYITGRWTDALSAGSVVAGIPPNSESIRQLFWPEALLDLGTVDQREGLKIIAHAVDKWVPETAKRNYRRSLERLDWRWRFKRIAEVLGLVSPRLDNELAGLKEILGADALKWKPVYSTIGQPGG
jgi:hypothetical protein